MTKLKTLSIIIPVYNEENYIAEIIKKVKRANSVKLKKEIIVIDDCSTDRTAKILNGIKNIKVFFKKKNEGKGAALKIGFQKSTGDIVLIQDADLEYDPDNYPELIKPFLKQDVDVVYGSRFISQHPHRVLYFWHFMGNFFLTTFSNIMTNLNLTDMETGYKAFNGDLIRKIGSSLKSKRFGFEPEITAKVAKIMNVKIYEVGISYFGRTYQEGKKIGWRDGLIAIWEIFKYNFWA